MNSSRVPVRTAATQPEACGRRIATKLLPAAASVATFLGCTLASAEGFLIPFQPAFHDNVIRTSTRVCTQLYCKSVLYSVLKYCFDVAVCTVR